MKLPTCMDDKHRIFMFSNASLNGNDHIIDGVISSWIILYGQHRLGMQVS
jgi:hypothetical protein